MKTDTTVAPDCTSPRRGRPRSEAAEQAIFTAVEELMAVEAAVWPS